MQMMLLAADFDEGLGGW